MLRERCLAILAGAALFLALPASADEAAVCAPVAKVPPERHLRQLTLDLLGRPPTWEEYKAVQAKGSVSEEDIRAMMNDELFYTRVRNFHRALLRSNISASVFDNGNSRLGGNGTSTPFGFANNPSTALRGVNGQSCNADVEQSSCLTTIQDKHAAPLTAKPRTSCTDDMGVPMPVSYDYDTNYYTCTELAVETSNALTTCDQLADLPATDAWGQYRYFCDNRVVGGAVKSHLCKPDRRPGKPGVALTIETKNASGLVESFDHPDPASKPSLLTLKRCTLDLGLNNNIRGSFAPIRGCIQREGYVTKPAPYWAPAGSPATVKVCAIEAQERDHNPWTRESCETGRFANDRSCGCGVGMRRCGVSNIGLTTDPLFVRNVHDMRVAAFNEEPLRIAESVVRRDEPYYNILTTRRSFVNGTLSEFYRQRQGVGVFSATAPAPLESIPAIAYTDAANWKEYTRDESHSGVLTTPGFLYRFPTHRARVSEFYEAFLCKTFVPGSETSLPDPEDSCNRENNLAKRCGCNYCHATIEPTGAHWGRYAERAAQFLPANQFPRFDPKCRDCAINGDTNCGGECSQYVMQAYDGDGASSLGLLKTYLYRTADEEQNIEAGPRLLVERMYQSGELERCTVKRVWNEFLGRPMTAEEQRMYLAPLASDFAKSGHRFKSLIERVVTTDAYRRID
ncbi:DUF1585 domain-containing protein [Myxococcus llanfairpwllgwyngyllgogerychwyrndrobwllllantysiliogogogochensis]|uniref:DUF1585 domain-containing protein n=1 Tax=Myxococcus llanfairpwllgwyngyllgogerychwyrndrobwllllantysiliogogogochensis TaxID=2590453 RepID=A0A540X5N5_9BACT|nr:DUF1585 domain-containing protein [Myxococcus llanfairpwllgwyngyllgogerychwyrndrobwllllantysiliogogogochensis]TQF16567.1 DUF1585 domain-containing protein [Myxococcus llanfairpwllgwyngyllgogerychwyrndrobwllllantysiliogogogochensis]